MQNRAIEDGCGLSSRLVHTLRSEGIYSEQALNAWLRSGNKISNLRQTGIIREKQVLEWLKQEIENSELSIGWPELPTDEEYADSSVEGRCNRFAKILSAFQMCYALVSWEAKDEPLGLLDFVKYPDVRKAFISLIVSLEKSSSILGLNWDMPQTEDAVEEEIMRMMVLVMDNKDYLERRRANHVRKILK